MGHGKIRIGAPGYISASQVANLFGCGYGTRLDMYERYMGTQGEREVSDEAKRSMEFGTFFEDAVARFWADKNGVKIKKCGETAYWSDDMPYFICHPDRLVIGKDAQGLRTALEIKCVSPYSDGWGEDGSPEIPDNYYFQVQSYYACKVPCDRVFVVCMKGNRITSHEITRDDDVVAEIRARVKALKESFDRGEIPEPENYEEASRFYSRRVRRDVDGVGANDEVLGIYDQLIRIHFDQAKLETQEDELKTDLMKRLGDLPAFTTTNGNKVKSICWWSDTRRSSLDIDRLKAEHPEIDFNEYTTTKDIRSFRISFPRKERENG